MRNAFSSSLIIIFAVFAVMATIKQTGDNSSAKYRGPDSVVSSLSEAAMSTRLVGSWKNYKPNLSDWIEVDPGTGKPLISVIPQMTNLQGRPQKLAPESDS